MYHAQPCHKNVQSRVQLRSADFAENSNEIGLRLVWESIGRQNLKYTVAVHVLDADRQILFHVDYAQNRGEILVPERTIWVEETGFSREKLSCAKFIGIVLYSNKNMQVLLPDRGTRDWNNQRLIIALPEKS